MRRLLMVAFGAVFGFTIGVILIPFVPIALAVMGMMREDLWEEDK